MLRRIESGLTLGDANDRAESEADRAADAVINGGTPDWRTALAGAPARVVRRQCAACKAEEEEEETNIIRRKEARPRSPPRFHPIVAQTLRSPGQALEAVHATADGGALRL